MCECVLVCFCVCERVRECVCVCVCGSINSPRVKTQSHVHSTLDLRTPGWQEVWANNKCVMQGSTSEQGASILQHHDAILNRNVKSQQQRNVSRARMGAVVHTCGCACACASECTMHTRVRACTYAHAFAARTAQYSSVH